MRESEARYIREKLEGLERDVLALKTILERLDDLLFRKNGGQRALVHIINRHESFIVEARSLRKKIMDYAVGFVLGLVSAGAIFWFSVASKRLL